jgi:hypothetical protein
VLDEVFGIAYLAAWPGDVDGLAELAVASSPTRLTPRSSPQAGRVTAERYDVGRVASSSSRRSCGTMRILIYNWKDLAHPAAGGAEVFTEEVARAPRPARPRRDAVRGGGGGPSRRRVRRGRPGGSPRRQDGRVPGRAALLVRAGAAAYDIVVDEINTRPFLTPRWLRGAPVVALIHQLAREIWSYELPFPVSVLGATCSSRSGCVRIGRPRR